MKYISRFKCKKIQKKYILPNKNWFIPLNNLDIFIRKKYNLLELLTKEKILIKITYCRNHDLREINKNFIGLPNLVQTYYTFFCYDNSMTINNTQTFINPENNDYVKDCYHVTYELMKYYKKGNLIKYVNKMNQKWALNAVRQLLYCQLNIFSQFMYTHNDIKLSNILIKKHKEEIKIVYKYVSKTCNSRYEFILSDYDKIITFGNTYKKGLSKSFSLEEYYSFSLFNNLYQTIKVLGRDNYVNNSEKQNMETITKEHICKYYNKEIDKSQFLKLQLKININFVEKIINNIQNNNI